MDDVVDGSYLIIFGSVKSVSRSESLEWILATSVLHALRSRRRLILRS